jgi:aspartate ammonia-lyase
VAGIEANVKRCTELFERSFALATHIVPYLGHEKTTALVKECLAKKPESERPFDRKRSLYAGGTGNNSLPL